MENEEFQTGETISEGGSKGPSESSLTSRDATPKVFKTDLERMLLMQFATRMFYAQQGFTTLTPGRRILIQQTMFQNTLKSTSQLTVVL